MDFIPYTYLIGWTTLNKWYYGVEYGLKKSPHANPENLWSAYFTSSNLVTYYRKNYGEPDIIQVRKIFCSGSSEEKMEKSITWEKRVLSRIDITKDIWLNGRIGGNVCSVTNKKICKMRYGVENPFQAEEIKEKIKITNLKRYGVEHPSLSKELLEKKKQNNIKKYGVSCTLNLPHVREKVNKSIRSEHVKNKRKQTIFTLYGVEYSSQRDSVKKKVANTLSKLSNRSIVNLIREYKRVFDITLTSGWYQLSNEKLESIVSEFRQKYGTFTYEELTGTNIVKKVKKYSGSIKKLQKRNVVKEIKKYKEKFGRCIKIGRSWDRKQEYYLNTVLGELVKTYGVI